MYYYTLLLSFFPQTFSIYQSYPRDRRWWSLSCHMTGTSTPSTTLLMSFFLKTFSVYQELPKGQAAAESVMSCRYHFISFQYSQPPDSSRQTLHCWFLRLFYFGSICMEWPSPSFPTETLSGLIQIKSKNISFPKIVDLPCFLFRAAVFIHSTISRSPGCLLPVLSCVYFSFVWSECLTVVRAGASVCVRVCACVCT